MLDATTKRRIDTARDLLVGKVPDPKSQVEQITIALIYKFMDDIDAESEEFGGTRAFFAGEFARYGWAKLMRSGLGGHETLNLYAEAITRMPENPGIPQLFRTIFNNAFLPYRDPETLRAFLKVIDEFTYDHSERLGDAFEYLLSVLGSQGDAGQFRTPRHIIDFIVAVIDPKKNDTILDPACGTAGFLISSYKHILRANTDVEGNSTLTPDEKGKLATNFKGYDISPDMVRLSLVNMYLHGFAAPHIFEYDTLTSQDKWNDYADVILANPPFMSPKGGIRPHNRFSVQSKRSEVLFVDYMAEHLTPGGRAGIIVPEGIIFQSQKAHKQLRKLLVKELLVAVVSLPAGVFQPYSGVKTSILMLDKSLAKKTDRVAFFKVENDGYDLGAQRRPIDKNDLPQARAEIAEYLRRLRAGEAVADFKPALGLVVEKEKLAADGDYSLSGERYRQQARSLHTKWKTVTLGEICSFMTGGTPKSRIPEYYDDGEVPWLVSGDIHQIEIRDCEKRITERGVENSNARLLPPNSVLIALNGQGKTRGTVALLRMEGATCNQSLVAINPLDTATIIPEFIFWVLRSMYSDIRALTGDNERSGLNIPILKSIQIPLPPLDVQREIVAEIEGYQRVIDGARAVVENYRPHIAVDPAWPVVRIKELCEMGRGRVISRKDINNNPGPYPVYSSQTSNSGIFGYLGTYDFDGEYVTWTTDGANAGTVFHRTGKFNCTNVCGTLKCLPDAASRIDMRFLAQVLGQVAKSYVIQVGNPKLMNKEVAKIPIPIPLLKTQQAIAAEIEAEQALVAANRELVERMEGKIRAAVGRVGGEGKTKGAN